MINAWYHMPILLCPELVCGGQARTCLYSQRKVLHHFGLDILPSVYSNLIFFSACRFASMHNYLKGNATCSENMITKTSRMRWHWHNDTHVMFIILITQFHFNKKIKNQFLFSLSSPSFSSISSPFIFDHQPSKQQPFFLCNFKMFFSLKILVSTWERDY
jgi:hypothetical protein